MAIGFEVFTDIAKRSRNRQGWRQALRREGASREQGQGVPVDEDCRRKQRTLESMATGAEWRGIEGDRGRRGIATIQMGQNPVSRRSILPSLGLCGTTRASSRLPPFAADRLAEPTSSSSPNHRQATLMDSQGFTGSLVYASLDRSDI